MNRRLVAVVVLLFAGCQHAPAAPRADDRTAHSVKQSPEELAVANAHDLVQEASALLRKDAGALWGVRLDDVPWFFVLGKQVFVTVDPELDGYEPAGGLWTGPLPPGISPANTSLEWAGKKWAMVMLPLPADRTQAHRLLIHEVWHVVQPTALPMPQFSETGSGAALLDAPDGRIWLQLEWRALAAALGTNGNEQDQAVRNALLFRARRYSHATAAERDRERLLDLSEGLAEYTGWKLSGSKPSAFATVLERDAPDTESYLRAFAYFTGPAYAMLLDQRRSGWIRELQTSLDLQALLAETLGEDRQAIRDWLDGAGSTEELVAVSNRAAESQGLAELEAKENERWRRRQAQQSRLRALFVDGPTLRIRPGSPRITFDPRRQVSLGEAGTVMGNLGWKQADGSELAAPDGALVTSDWQEIWIPLSGVRVPAGVLRTPTNWTGEGWTLTLAAGWRLDRTGDSMTATPPGAAADDVEPHE